MTFLLTDGPEAHEERWQFQIYAEIKVGERPEINEVGVGGLGIDRKICVQDFPCCSFMQKFIN